MLIVFITILAIVFFLPMLGIPLTSGIALLFLLMLGGERRPIVVFLVSTLVPLLVYLFFTKSCSNTNPEWNVRKFALEYDRKSY